MSDEDIESMSNRELNEKLLDLECRSILSDEEYELADKIREELRFRAKYGDPGVEGDD